MISGFIEKLYKKGKKIKKLSQFKNQDLHTQMNQ